MGAALQADFVKREDELTALKGKVAWVTGGGIISAGGGDQKKR